MSRYDELWEKAKLTFLENTDTKYIIDMLDEDEQAEFWKLNEKKINEVEQWIIG